MSRNLLAVPVSIEVFAGHILMEGKFETTSDIPVDAKFHRSFYVPEKQIVMVILEHPSFPEYHAGEVINEAGYDKMPKFRRIE